MAEELFALLANTAGSQIRLDARLAEPSTVTAVGMNVLAPVASTHAGAAKGLAAPPGRLRPVIMDRRLSGFSTGEFTLTHPDLIAKAAALRHALVINHPFVDGNKRVGMPRWRPLSLAQRL